MSSKEDTSSSGRRYCLIGVGNIAATLDTIERVFYNNRIAIKRARAREGSTGLWITVMRKITKIS
jgi:hypothetical protein